MNDVIEAIKTIKSALKPDVKSDDVALFHAAIAGAFATADIRLCELDFGSHS